MASLKNKQARVEFVKKLPRNAVAAEVGVLRGGFSEMILEHATPKEFHMVDCWKHQTGNYVADPSNLKQHEMDEMYREVCEKFNDYENKNGVVADVHIHREFSRDAVKIFDDHYFDWVYIDADHTYDAACMDLKWWWPKVKPGGVLAGHDYHAKVAWVEVKRAVDEFLKEQDLSLAYTSNASYPDWAIIKPKGSHVYEGEKGEDIFEKGGACAYPIFHAIDLVGRKPPIE